MLLAIEISRSQCAALIADSSGKPIQHLRAAFSSNQNAATQWLQAMKLARDVCISAAIEPEALLIIVLAFDGVFSGDGTVQRTVISGGFEGYNLKRGIEEHLHNSNIVLVPAIRAQGLGEHHFGVLQNETDWIFVDLDHQMNSLAAKSGTLFPSDLGAQVVERDGPVDDFGKRGTLRAFCAATAFEARCRSYSLAGAAQAFELRGMNFAAQSVAEDFISRLAQGICGGVVLLNPSTICFGGNFATTIWPHIKSDLALKMRDYTSSEILAKIKLQLSVLGADGPALGALALALQSQKPV